VASRGRGRAGAGPRCIRQGRLGCDGAGGQERFEKNAVNGNGNRCQDVSSRTAGAR
jgi:hypothetical protein